MLTTRNYEFWFFTGSQLLYGQETLNQVDADTQKMVDGLNATGLLPYPVVYKGTLKSSEEILTGCKAANHADDCAGIITWCHTFSPAKMWIHGLKALTKPLLHLHTQFNKEIPWDSIDMDFMNLNQAAHGDREYGYIGARMEIPRKIIVGYWADEKVANQMADWMDVAVGYCECQTLKICRFGDNMRDVAVTDGDRVEAEIRLGWTTDYYGIGDLVSEMETITEAQVDAMMDDYRTRYDFDPAADIDSIRYQAKIQCALEQFMKRGGYTAFSTNFQVLHGMKQLPGLACQDMMYKGYGFGGEGDWKIAAMVRIMKIMAHGKRTSFMEDYTLNYAGEDSAILNAHMLEVCPTIAETKPVIEVHPLGIGDREAPARLKFKGYQSGRGVACCLNDMGNRFRLIVQEVTCVPSKDMPKLPVASILWKPLPNLETAAHAWILAGGAHHTSFSMELTATQLEDWAEMMGIECVIINEDTNIRNFKHELKWNSVAYGMKL
ncbi:MAG: L-arabinose isomerase [Lachnospiraceae bacterium]